MGIYLPARIEFTASSDGIGYVPLTKTVLNYRFQKMLSRSIFDHINNLRIRRMCWLLENTDFSMLEIALAMDMDKNTPATPIL